MKWAVLVLVALCMAYTPAFADMPGHVSHVTDNSSISMAGQEYLRALDAMHTPMMAGVMDPNPDAAFVKGMIPHHLGAIDMAHIQLRYGKDPELRKLARAIIDAQEKEIRFMRTWLEKHVPDK